MVLFHVTVPDRIQQHRQARLERARPCEARVCRTKGKNERTRLAKADTAPVLVDEVAYVLLEPKEHLVLVHLLPFGQQLVLPPQTKVIDDNLYNVHPAQRLRRETQATNRQTITNQLRGRNSNVSVPPVQSLHLKA